ncbi:sporulation integral membrane protein YtvI [Acetitomaculum ruminis DSM 5522]|uniref:Sporulation integral membrane protein YtvI n=1 Tax=Acetitomaculum ruminis DSM 5522 TaxID=1120918 RepID=A0A1I0XE49_9FIRM|nr:sporulation integral membrane protein YtvI [Acetitomaculum ruminis]SFA98706.1 sporulation integral membrane protein YtvI [Acetitomaculum ruminis DSM 5522]
MNFQNINLKRIVNVLIFLLITVAFLYFGIKLIVFFMPFVVAWIIAAIANPLVKFLEKKLRILRKHGSIIVIIMTLALIGIGGYLLMMKLWTQAVNFISTAPDAYKEVVQNLENTGSKYYDLFEKLPDNIQNSLADIYQNLSSYVGNIVQTLGKPTINAAGNFAMSLPVALVYTIVTLIAAYFFIADREKIINKYHEIVPDSIEEKLNFIYDNLGYAVGGYFKAQFKIMAVIGIIVFIGLIIIGVKYAILLAVLIAFVDMLPFFGTGTIFFPWGVVCFLEGNYKRVVGFIVIYLVCQLVRQLIQPKLLGDSMGLTPLTTLVLMFIGFKLKGVLGMIFAVPLGMIIINMYSEGIFDNFIENIRGLIKDFNDWRNIKNNP